MTTALTGNSEAANLYELGAFSRVETDGTLGAGGPLTASLKTSRALFLYRQAEKLKTTASHAMQLVIHARLLSLASYSAQVIYVQEIRNELVDAVTALAEEIELLVRENVDLEATTLTERKHDVTREVSYLCTVIDVNEGEAITKFQTATTWFCPTISKVEIPSSDKKDPLGCELSSRIGNLRMVWGLTNGDLDSLPPHSLQPFSISKKIVEMPREEKTKQLLEKYRAVKLYWNTFSPVFRDGLDSLLEDRADLTFSIKTKTIATEPDKYLLRIEKYEKSCRILEDYKNSVLEIVKEFLAVKLGEIPISTSEKKEDEDNEAELMRIETPYRHLCLIYTKMQTHAYIYKERLNRLKEGLGLPL